MLYEQTKSWRSSVIARDAPPATGPIVAGGSWNVVFSVSLPTTEIDWEDVTGVQRWAIGALSHSGSKIRLRMQCPVGAESSTINAMYVGHGAGAGDDYDFETTPTQVLVSGSGSWTLTANGAAVTSDEVNFALDITKKFLISWQQPSSPPSSQRLRTGNGVNYNAYYKVGVAEASTVNKSSDYNNYADRIIMIDQIEAFY